MNYLLDTDSIVDFFHYQRGIHTLMPSLLQTGIAISMLTFIELWGGVFRSRDRPQRSSYRRSFKGQRFFRSLAALPSERRVYAATSAARGTTSSTVPST